MKVGFRLPYRRCDATYSAVPIIRLAERLGLTVEIFPYDSPEQVHVHTDRMVLGRETNYAEWVKSLDHLIYTDSPSSEDVDLATEAKIKTSYLVQWDALTANDINLLPSYSRVVCPANCVANLLVSKLKLSNIFFAPWDTGLPITRELREVDPGHINIVWPLDGSQVARQEPRFLPYVRDLLVKCPHIRMVVPYSNSMPAVSIGELTELAKETNGRLGMIRNASRERLQVLYGSSDLCLWPAISEAVGIVGVSSTSMSTPVMAFDHPVIGELLHDRQNGLLLPCNLKSNWFDVPYVEPDYNMFASYLADLVGHPEELTRLRRTTTSGMYCRRQQFESCWNIALTQF